MRNHSSENDFDLHENETACRTHFHVKCFALILVLKQRHKRTRKWPILENLYGISYLCPGAFVSKARIVISVVARLQSKTRQISDTGGASR